MRLALLCVLVVIGAGCKTTSNSLHASDMGEGIAVTTMLGVATGMLAHGIKEAILDEDGETPSQPKKKVRKETKTDDDIARDWRRVRDRRMGH